MKIDKLIGVVAFKLAKDMYKTEKDNPDFYNIKNVKTIDDALLLYMDVFFKQWWTDNKTLIDFQKLKSDIEDDTKNIFLEFLGIKPDDYIFKKMAVSFAIQYKYDRFGPSPEEFTYQICCMNPEKAQNVLTAFFCDTFLRLIDSINMKVDKVLIGFVALKLAKTMADTEKDNPYFYDISNANNINKAISFYMKAFFEEWWLNNRLLLDYLKLKKNITEKTKIVFLEVLHLRYEEDILQSLNVSADIINMYDRFVPDVKKKLADFDLPEKTEISKNIINKFFCDTFLHIIYQYLKKKGLICGNSRFDTCPSFANIFKKTNS